MSSRNARRLWLRWVLANGLGELLGLGLTAGATVLAFSQLERWSGLPLVLLSLLSAAASGAFEATIVGLLQWWAMHPWFPVISRRAWWLGTLGGALVAYVLGYLPSTLMSLGEPAGATTSAEPPLSIMLLLAAGLGLVAGAVLSFAQWLVLRKATPRAAWWIPANMLAWLLGMPILFWAIDAAQKGQPFWQSLLLLAGSLLLSGLIVGAIHGAVLVRLVQPEAGQHTEPAGPGRRSGH